MVRKFYTWSFKEIEMWSNPETRPEQVGNPEKLKNPWDTTFESLGAIRRAKEAAAAAAAAGQAQ